MENNQEKHNWDIMHSNPNNWRGIFYVNSQDSRIIVPKKNQKTGLTFNFGNKHTYIGFVLILVIFFVFRYLI